MISTSHKTTKLILQCVLNINSEINKLVKAIEDDNELSPRQKNDTWKLIAPFFELIEWGQYLPGVIESLRNYANLKGKSEFKLREKEFKENKQDSWESDE